MSHGHGACEYCIRRRPFNRSCMYTSPFMYSTRCMSLVPGDLVNKAARHCGEVQTVCTASAVWEHDHAQAVHAAT